MTKVRVTWEFEVDNTWGETLEQCLEIAKEEFKTLTPDDVNFEVMEDDEKGPYYDYEYEDDYDECGFNPYLGCYDYDC